MPITALMSQDVQVFHRTVTGQDDSGVEEVAYVAGSTVEAYVSRGGATETLGGRDQPEALWTFLLDVPSGVTAYDRLVFEGMTFEVMGVPADAIRPGVDVAFTRVTAQFVEG